MQHFDITHFGVTTIFLFHMRLKLFEKKHLIASENIDG